MKTRTLIFGGLSMALIIWAIGFGGFVSSTLSLTPQSTDQKTDAIIVLTGGGQRIQEGLQLFALKKVPQLFITGVHPSVSKDSILKLWKNALPLPKCCVSLGHKATSTVQNAQETKDWITANNIASIHLVTANYHMPRAYGEFHAAMPELQIYTHPISNHGLPMDHWYFWNVMLSEYHKTMFRHISLTLNLPALEGRP